MTPEDWKDVTTIPPPRTVANVSLFATGEESAEDIFRKAAYIHCHVIPGIPDATGTIDPALTMKSIAPLRLKDPWLSMLCSHWGVPKKMMRPPGLMILSNSLHLLGQLIAHHLGLRVVENLSVVTNDYVGPRPGEMR